MPPSLLRGRTVSPLLVAALALSPSHAGGQNGPALLPSAPFRWSEWEMQGPRPDSATLDGLGICPRVAAQSTGFHWMDADGDGLADLVFSGPVAWCTEDPEGSSTAIYLSRGDSLVLALNASARVAAIWRPLPAHPVSLLLTYSFGDGGGEDHYAWYTPHLAGDSTVFRRAGEFAVPPEARIPDRLLPHPRAFSVAQGEEAPLHAAPADSTSAFVIYPGGSRGVALAEWTDPAGREWWFARMDGVEHHDAGDPSGPGEALFGWAPVRFLVPLPQRPPRGPVNTLTPFAPVP